MLSHDWRKEVDSRSLALDYQAVRADMRSRCCYMEAFDSHPHRKAHLELRIHYSVCRTCLKRVLCRHIYRAMTGDKNCALSLAFTLNLCRPNC